MRSSTEGYILLEAIQTFTMLLLFAQKGTNLACRIGRKGARQPCPAGQAGDYILLSK